MVRLLSIFILLIFSFHSLMGQHWVASVTPNQNETNAAAATEINIEFTEGIILETLNQGGLQVHGSLSGLISPGGLTYDANSFTATFTPPADFKAGETITVSVTTITHNSAAGVTMPDPYVWKFKVASAPATAQFAVSSTITNVGSGNDAPYFITVGDFNNDGHVDLATANKTSSNISILINDGSGNFTNPANPAAGGTPDAITAADFNRDGFLDLAVANANNGQAGILLNDGQGNFAAPVQVAVGNFPHGINSGDLNGNGLMDIAVSNFNSASVSILRNSSNGTFTPESSPGVNNGVESALIADFNNDGDLDIAVSHFSTSNFIVMENDNSGSFTPVANSNLGSSAHLAGAGDFNGDGWVDAIVSHNASNNLTILMNDMTGSLVPQPTLNQTGSPWSALACDLDGDGDQDLATTSYNSARLFIWENNGQGSFTQKPSIIVGSNPHLAVAADFNGDNALDLAVANDGANSVSILLNQPTVGIEDDVPTAPRGFSLAQNYPNPFNPSTTIEFFVPKRSDVTLSVFNPVGKKVAMLVNENLVPGKHGINWDATNLPSGVYFYRLEANGFEDTRKMILLR